MSTQAFAQRLAAEFKRGGKKTLILGALLLVGGYFWFPMLWKAARPNSADAPVAAISSPAQAAPLAAAPAATPSAAVPSRAPSDWRSLQAKLRTLPVLRPLRLEDLVRDPFSRDWLKPPDSSPELAATPTGPVEPEVAMSFTVSSTMVGARLRAAIINGEVYRVGDRVPPDGEHQYVVKDILPNRVLLEGEREIWIEVPQE